MVSLLVIYILSFIRHIIVRCIAIHLIVHPVISIVIQVLVHNSTVLLLACRVRSFSLNVSIRFVLFRLAVISQIDWFLGLLKNWMAQLTGTLKCRWWYSTYCDFGSGCVNSFTLQSLILCVDYIKYRFNCRFLA